MADPMPAIRSILGMPAEPPLDPYTLAVAEKAVRDRILTTHWASEARLYRLAADAIHKLGENS